MKLQLHTTYGAGNWDEQFTQTVLFVPGETENRVVNLYPEIEFQTLEGFGGAITDSAAYIYSMMSEAQKRKLMKIYFSPERMNYQMVRIPIGWILRGWSAVSSPCCGMRRPPPGGSSRCCWPPGRPPPA